MTTISSTRGPEPSPRIRKMDVTESSTKRRKKDFNGFAPAPAPLATSYSNQLYGQPLRKQIHLEEDGSFKPHHPIFQKGTTALAFIFEEGIMFAVDHSSKSLKSVKNVVELNSHMVATISGGSEFLLQELQEKCYRQEQTEGRKTSVEEALNWLADTLSAYKEELSVGILIAVWNEPKRGLYCMNGRGEVVNGTILTTGSGSVASSLRVRMEYVPFSDTHSYGLRSRRKRNMSVNEAADLAKRAICHAASMAPHSGDIVSVYHLGSGGCKKLLEDDLEEWQKANLKSQWIKYEVIGKGW